MATPKKKKNCQIGKDSYKQVQMIKEFNVCKTLQEGQTT